MAQPLRGGAVQIADGTYRSPPSRVWARLHQMFLSSRAERATDSALVTKAIRLWAQTETLRRRGRIKSRATTCEKKWQSSRWRFQIAEMESGVRPCVACEPSACC